MSTQEKMEQAKEIIGLISAMFDHNHVDFEVGMNALAYALAANAYKGGVSRFDAINGFVVAVKNVYEDTDDTGEEGQG